MRVNKLLMVYLGLDFLFLLSGGLMLGFALVSEANMRSDPTPDTVAPHVLLRQCPLTAAVVNAIFVFVTFFASLPALTMRQNKGWLRAQGWLIVLCALFTLVLGLAIWFGTLQTRSNLLSVWASESPLTQNLLQQKFECCGYLSSTEPPFVVDNVCPNALAAAQRPGCITPFSNFANGYLDVVFTAFFGIVGIDTLLLLSTVMVLKDRHEQDRYRHIDEKNGAGGI